MNCVVTGGCGFIGSNVVDLLLANNYNVKIIDNLSTGYIENLNPAATFVNADICDFQTIKQHFTGADIVFHLAALPRVEPSIHDPLPYNKHNIEGTLSVLKASVDAGINKFIFSSSSSIYGQCGAYPVDEEKDKQPLSPYALQKLCCEEYCKLFNKLFNINTICLRYFNVYGKRQPTIGAYVPVIGIFENQKSSGQKLTITGDGSQTRDFVNVLDVAKANLYAANSNLTGYRYYNVGSGKNYKIIDIAKTISNNIEFVEPRIEPKTTLANISKIKNELGWNPTIDLLEWIKFNINLS